jgi:hypothetical protein
MTEEEFKVEAVKLVAHLPGVLDVAEFVETLALASVRATEQGFAADIERTREYLTMPYYKQLEFVARVYGWREAYECGAPEVKWQRAVFDAARAQYGDAIPPYVIWLKLSEAIEISAMFAPNAKYETDEKSIKDAVIALASVCMPGGNPKVKN